MPAGGPDRIVVLPTCASGCAYVALLLEQLEAAERAEDEEPEPA